MVKRFEKATVGDYVACFLIPFWGALVGLVAVIRGERKRGLTMMGVGSVWLLFLMWRSGVF